MRSDKNRVTHFEMIYCLFLESVQLEGILDVVKKSETIDHGNGLDIRLVCHHWHKFVEVRHRLVDIYNMCPVSFLNFGTPWAPANGHDRIQMRSLQRMNDQMNRVLSYHISQLWAVDRQALTLFLLM